MAPFDLARAELVMLDLAAVGQLVAIGVAENLQAGDQRLAFGDVAGRRLLGGLFDLRDLVVHVVLDARDHALGDADAADEARCFLSRLRHREVRGAGLRFW